MRSCARLCPYFFDVDVLPGGRLNESFGFFLGSVTSGCQDSCRTCLFVCSGQ